MRRKSSPLRGEAVRTPTLAALFLLLFVSGAQPQATTVRLKVRVILVDKDLNQKPVPRLDLTVQRTDAPGEPVTIKTGFDGTAETTLPAGEYKLTTPQPLELQGKSYQWQTEFTLTGPDFSLELSNDNAKTTALVPETAAHPSDDLGGQFKHLRDSVATVYSEFGHGTGFLVDQSGLILTNEHVVEDSEYLAVQFDEKRKVAARLLASDPKKDVAVLWVNLGANPDAVIAPIAKAESGKAPVAEGDRVFTIGSPLTQQKVLTTGVVSRVDAAAIISDININPGNSGGPLFNSAGFVIGVTTYNEQASRGPGLSGIVRIEEAVRLIEQAKGKTAGAAPPPAALLPVEPAGPFPVDSLQGSAPASKQDWSAHAFAVGDFNVTFFTPALEYRAYMEEQRANEKEREKRGKKRGDSTKETPSGPDVKNWEADKHRPEITIRVEPQVKMKFWATMASPRNQVKARFKTDFYQMRLLCGAQEVTPIRPGKFKLVVDTSGSVVINDTTYVGMYDYLPDAIGPGCAQATLEIYPAKGSPPTVKPLDLATVQAIWDDFEPYRRAQSSTPPGTPKN
jgi:S1-C subfamily serine protease